MRRLRNRKRGGQKGVTLFEVLIALALFALIIVPISKSFLTAMKVNRRARETMIATDVAQSIMEGFAGKSYFEVCEAIRKAPGGFSFASKTDIDSSGKYALSTINNSYYNCGNEHLQVLPGGFSSNITGVAGGPITQDGYVNAETDMPFDKVMVEEAVKKLRNDQMAGVLLPYEDPWVYNNDRDNTKFTSDKCLYYGFSTETYSDPYSTPIMAYLLYTRIEKDNLFFDATVTFTPTAQANFRKDATDTNERDYFFTYEVIVKVYQYEYDPSVGDWVGRFDDSTEGKGNIEGSPIAVMVSGIPNRNTLDKY